MRGGSLLILYSGEISGSELDIIECGTQKCDGGYACGPSVRNFYIMHFILEGKGIYTVNSKTYQLSKGQVFLIAPDTLVYYKADREDPWEYCWAGFNGSKADYMMRRCGLSVCSPVTSMELPFIKQCFSRMLNANTLSNGRSAYLKGYFYILLSKLIDREKNDFSPYKSNQESYVNKASEFIRVNFNKKINIKGIANYVGLDSKYLWRLFKKFAGKSPSQFLMETRMENAATLLKSTSYSVSDISRSVGYEDPLQFSKIFKKFSGCSPKGYRNRI